MLDYSDLNVAVIGDFMLDVWEHGEIVRPNPEAPEIPDFRDHSREERLGGAGYLCRLIAGLGAHCHPVTTIGEGYYRDDIIELLDSSNVETSGIFYCCKRQPTVKVRFIVDGKQTGLRWSMESTYPLDTLCTENIIDHTGSWLSTFDAIIFADYNKGVCSKQVINAVMEMCKAAKVPVFVDPKFDNFWEYKGATIFKPNWKETTASMSGLGLETYEWTNAAAEIFEELGCENIVITQGSAGLQSIIHGIWKMFPAHRVEVVDVCGAGDAVMAVLSLEYLRNGGDIFGAAELANWAGALAVQQHGTATITTKDLEAYYE